VQRPFRRRILLLDNDQPARAAVVDTLRRAANTEAIVVDDAAQLISNVRFGIYAAVFADADLVGDQMLALIDAVRSAGARPMLIVASNEVHHDFDGELVTLIVRKPYDVEMVTGVLLSAVLEIPPPDGGSPAGLPAPHRGRD
jgi:DNA-binding NtrC family response regulator